MSKFVRAITCLFLALNLLSCTAEETDSDLVSIDVPTPLVILVDRTLTISEDLEFVFTAPWSVVNFKSINNSTRIITVLGGAFIVTDPISGTRKVLTLESLEGALNYEGVIFPSRDTDCDGLVSDAEAAAGVGPATPCQQIRTEPCPTPGTCTPADYGNNSIPVALLDEVQFYLTDMGSQGSGASGTDEESSVAKLYRGLTFQVEAGLEGWFGSPDRPESNFYRQFFFNTRAN